MKKLGDDITMNMLASPSRFLAHQVSEMNTCFDRSVCKIPRIFERVSPSDFLTLLSVSNSRIISERDLLSSEIDAKSATQKPCVF